MIDLVLGVAVSFAVIGLLVFAGYPLMNHFAKK